MTDDPNYQPPPPQAPPAAPAAPAYAQPYAAAPAGGSKAGWIVAGILAAVLVVLVILYFTGVLDRSPRSSTGGAFGGTPSTGTGGFGAPSTGSSGGMSGSGAVTMASVAGTWGPGCPGSRNDTVTFTSSGSYLTGADSGSFTIYGNTLSLTSSANGSTTTIRWEPMGDNAARAEVTSRGRSATVYRCP